uniref:Uncharacterized protein n=1 Tax=Oryza sativa subsp. japonica TaxID=39947 RepID=H2KW44_ORYSJ|nr:hypothetical protein LOC_Os11g47448 [Oryza sativa Japonica Group]
MDLGKSASNTSSMKKLQDDGALPGRGTMQREARGLDSDTVERRVGQIMVSAPSEAVNIPAPLYDKDPIERVAAINVAMSLKESSNKEASDVATATTSGSKVVKKGRKFSSVTGTHRKAADPVVGFSSIFDYVVMAVRAHHTVLLRTRAEMERILQAGARGMGREIKEARAVASLATQRANDLVHDLLETREDLLKMRELVAGNEMQRQGLERRMSELENNLAEIHGSLRTSYTGLHQLAGECGVTTTIPAHPDEFSLLSQPDFRFRIYKLSNKLLIEFILNVH